MSEAVTIGKLLVEEALPEDMRDRQRVFDKGTASTFFGELARKHPDEYEDVLHKLTNISRTAGTEYGNNASMKLTDLQTPPKLQALRESISAKIDSVAQSRGLTKEEKNVRIEQIMRDAMPVITSTLKDEVLNDSNAFGESVKLGVRGSPTQLIQILFGDMLVSDHKDRAIPIPGIHGYGQGVTPMEYWAGTYGSRKGYSSVQFATAKAGFLGKQLTMMAQRVKVTGPDCGATDTGIIADGADPDIIGTVLARPAKGIPAGTVIEKKHLPVLKDEKPLVRSVISCQQEEGVCQKCAGRHNQDSFHPIGSHIGITAARTASEPLTQVLGLSAKHSGGVVGLNDNSISGFEEINQFVQVPKSFKGASVLAPVTGRVQQITAAPQGGKYMHVGGNQVYIPEGRELQVKLGDSVDAGDMLTDGTPNPAEIAAHKGLGEGRVYFLDKFAQILKSNGVPTHRRHIEILARAFFDRVNVTNPDGVGDYIIGDSVSYGDIQRGYKPRPGFEKLVPGRTVGKYLEKPVLHYTIGTKITPAIAKNLKEQGIADISVHSEDPGFEPEVLRIMDLPAKDKDWKTRMAGFNIQKSFLDAARRGASSEHETTSYVPKLMDPSAL